jgi:hypothetical protein
LSLPNQHRSIRLAAALALALKKKDSFGETKALE